MFDRFGEFDSVEELNAAAEVDVFKIGRASCRERVFITV